MYCNVTNDTHKLLNLFKCPYGFSFFCNFIVLVRMCVEAAQKICGLFDFVSGIFLKPVDLRGENWKWNVMIHV